MELSFPGVVSQLIIISDLDQRIKNWDVIVRSKADPSSHKIQ